MLCGLGCCMPYDEMNKQKFARLSFTVLHEPGFLSNNCHCCFLTAWGRSHIYTLWNITRRFVYAYFRPASQKIYLIFLSRSRHLASLFSPTEQADLYFHTLYVGKTAQRNPSNTQHKTFD
jgi:hypothetical protein